MPPEASSKVGVCSMALELLTVSSTEMKPSQISDVIQLCSQVFQCDYSYYMNLPLDRVHVLGYIDGLLVSHALWLDRRLRVGDGPRLNSAYVEGVATREDRRKQGFGSAVMQRLQKEIAGYDLGALSPSRPEWYERLGWVRWQGPLWIVKDCDRLETSDECVLVYRTPQTGQIDLTSRLTGEWRPFELW